MSGPENEANAPSIALYRTFRFTVIWEGRPVAGINRVGGLTQTTQLVSHRSGAATITRKQAEQTAYGPITLERGRTHDLAFSTWANKQWYDPNGTPTDESSETVSLQDFLHDITLEMRNEAGEIILTYLISKCWASEFHAMPYLDGVANSLAIESITLQNGGYERVLPSAGGAARPG